MPLRTLDDLGDLAGRRVFVRLDLNVPLEDGVVTDDARIRASLPTLTELLERGASIVAASHLGRPNGRVDRDAPARPGRRAAPRARWIAWSSTSRPTASSAPRSSSRARPSRSSPAGSSCSRTCGSIPARRPTNGRSRSGSPAWPTCTSTTRSARCTARMRRWSRCRRSTGSRAGTPSPDVCSKREVEALSRLVGDPARPYVAVLGGAKVSDKLGTIGALVERVDALLIGGAMAFTFLAADGGSIGNSLVEPDRFDEVRAARARADERGVVLQLPEDVVAAPSKSLDAPRHTVPSARVPAGELGLDIGPRAVEEFARTIADAKTHRVERPDGGVRARAVQRRDPRGRHGDRRRERLLRRRRRRQPRGREEVRAGGAGSTTSRPAGAPRSSSSRAASCRASRSWR